MKTTTIPTKLNSRLVAEMLELAARMAPHPCTAHSLLDLNQTQAQGKMRAKLASIVSRRLHLVHHAPIWWIAKAFGIQHRTCEKRIKRSAADLRKQPWKTIYDRLP